MPKKYTDDMFAEIPELIEQGLDRNQIAERFGTSPNSLQVMCSRRGISLWPKARTLKAPASSLRMSTKPQPEDTIQLLRVDEFKQLQAKACELGTTPDRLARKLLTLIIRDDLYRAVIDTGPDSYIQQ